MSVLFEAIDLKRYFKTPRGTLHAVDGISFKMEAGRTLGVVGESGCGKSTLGRLIVHLLEPTGGRMIYEGRDVTTVSKHDMRAFRKDMQMIFQDPYSSLDPRKTVADTISEPLRNYSPEMSSADRDRRVAELMDTVGLVPRLAGSYPHELDGGRRQRIGIARALALDPKFIVCDEPVSALDVSIQAQILNLMMDIQDEKELTYMFITHDLSVVRHIADDIAVMYLGCLVESCSSRELFDRRLHPYTRALLSAIPTTDIDARTDRIILKGEITSPIDPKPGCRFSPRCPDAVDRCFSESPQAAEVMPGHLVACHRTAKINDL